jgi:putative endonuclease
MTGNGLIMKRKLHPFIYIMTNKYNNVLHTGVTSNLFKRVSEHKGKLVTGFTSQYNVTKLVYYEEFETMPEAIGREKQITGGSRQKKLDLINSKNPEWKDLYDEFLPKPTYRHCETAEQSKQSPTLFASPCGDVDCFVGKGTLLARTEKGMFCWQWRF